MVVHMQAHMVMVIDSTSTVLKQTSIAAPSLVGFDFSGDLVVILDGGSAEAGGTDGRRDAGIFPAHVPVVALSSSPPSATGTRSAYQ
jgi:hypothetical protein